MDELYELGEGDLREAVFGVGSSVKPPATGAEEPPVAGGGGSLSRWEVGSGEPKTSGYEGR